MIALFEQYYFQLQIKLLAIFKPTVLFDRINQLNWYKKVMQQWVDDQHFSAGSKVLEVGCASGALTAYIAESGSIPTGVDFSSPMIELAKSNNNGVDFSVADVLDLPFETESFDAVIAASLVNIVSDKSKAISELARTCHNGGKISVLVPLADFKDEDFSSLQVSLGISGFSAAAIEAWHKLAPKMKVSDVVALFEQAGLAEITGKEHLQGMVISVSGRKL